MYKATTLIMVALVAILAVPAMAQEVSQVSLSVEDVSQTTTQDTVSVSARGVIERLVVDVGSAAFTQAVAVVSGDGTFVFGPTTNAADVVTIPMVAATDKAGTALETYDGTKTNSVYVPIAFNSLTLRTWGANTDSNSVSVIVTYKRVR